MTNNQSIYSQEQLEEPPLTPPLDGTLQFLGPDTVKYISPPRIEVPRCRVAPRPPRPTAPAFEPLQAAPPPSYQSSVYPQMPQVAPAPMPMMAPQYHPQLVTSPPQMMYMQQPMMAPMMMTSPPVQCPPPAPVSQVSPTITLCINQSPPTTGTLGVGGGAAGGALICPKCRKGIIVREQNKFRKRVLIFLALCCCPLTCGLPLLCLHCNYVDTCGSCGKSYGHRGRKNYKKNVNAVKL